MSLKAMHIVFISCSIATAFFFGAWLLHDWEATKDASELAGGVVSGLTGVLLIIYAKAILRKLRQISYL